MKPFSRVWAICLLVCACAAVFFALNRPDGSASQPEGPLIRDVAMTSTEVLDAWLEEQAVEARAFFFEHRALYDRAARAALAPEVTVAYSEYSIYTSQAGRLSLVDYRVPGVVGHVSQGFDSVSPDVVSVADISPELDRALGELAALGPVSLVYTDPHELYGAGTPYLRFGFSAQNFPTAISCSMDLCYQEGCGVGEENDLEDGWYLDGAYHFMYGL